MEWTQLILEHFVQTIRYIAWPIVIFLGLILFRKDVQGLIRRLIKAKWGDKILEFSDIDEQGEAQELTPPKYPPVEPEITTEFSPQAKRILATLWKYQNRISSFRVMPNAEEYGLFMLGFAELLTSGLVGWTRDYGQAILTNKGKEYLIKHVEIQDSEDVYRL